MLFLYNIFSFFWSDVEQKDKKQISQTELFEKIKEIRKDKLPPLIIEGFGKKKCAQKSCFVVIKKSETSIAASELQKTRDKLRKSKFWVKIPHTSSEAEKKKTLEEINNIKNSLKHIDNYEKTFDEVWKNMTKYEDNIISFS